MKSLTILVAAALLSLSATARQATPITTAGQPAQLDIRSAGAHSLRVTLKPIAFKGDFPATPAVADRTWPKPAISLRSLGARVEQSVGRFRVAVEPSPLRVTVRDGAGRTIQTLRFENDGPLSFDVGDGPVLGMGEGGPRPVKGTPWREAPVQFDRRGALDTMEPRWQADMYGSRNPAAVLFGTSGWGLFVATPWVHVDLTDASRGKFLPVQPPATGPQTEGNQQQNAGKGLPPADQYVAGLYDVFVFDAAAPTDAIDDFASITGRASMPPRWALGYMQSHRTLEDETQMLRIIDTFREKKIPLDAVIYLGTGFAPVGWNTRQPSFDFNPNVFKRDPKAVLADMHARNVKVVVHMVPWDRDRLPTLHGTIPPAKAETVDASHIQSYWQQHVGLVRAGVDAFWPDEGDWFNLFERIKRHQLYYQGSLSTTPNVRPWSLQRNGFPGIARWGGWVWSGDTDTSWKTLEAQIAVGLNYSLSIGPYWGSDIGGFYPNREYTGELYARWFQFAAFCGSFRSHGRVWQMRLPWSWGGRELGPLEYGNNNQAPPPGDPRHIDPAELGNPAIEPIAKRYAELRYQLMPYTYTLAREARDRGLPLMRALWLHYPADATARSKGDQFLWGRDLLIAPVYTKGATTRAVYLPAGEWYDWWTKERVAGGRTIQRPVDLATMPIYARAGAIVPVDPIRQYTDEPVTEPTTLRVFPGANGEFTLYDDDGISQSYLGGRGNWIRMAWNDATRTLTMEPGAPSGATDVVRPRAFRVMLPDGRTQDASYAGRRVTVAFQERPKVGETITTESGLVYKFAQLGKGPQPQTGDLMVIHGIGTHVDGKEFWNTRTDNSPYEYTLGVDSVIRGFSEGMRNVREGDRIIITMKPDLAYGARERTGIPANSTLVFDYEILAVKAKSFARLMRDAIAAGTVDDAIAKVKATPDLASYYASPSSIQAAANAANRKEPGANEKVLALGVMLLPSAYQLHQTLGRLQGTRGDKAAAIKSYETALTLNPKKTAVEIRDHETATAALAALR